LLFFIDIVVAAIAVVAVLKAVYKFVSPVEIIALES
jgi:hypothetical protein